MTATLWEGSRQRAASSERGGPGAQPDRPGGRRSSPAGT